MTDRRHTDQASHAHKRVGDSQEFARLHQRLDDNDKIMAELLSARVESVRLHNETTASIIVLTASVTALTLETKGTREIETDVNGMIRLLGKISGFLGVLWKPMLFIGVLFGSAYLYFFGRPPP